MKTITLFVVSLLCVLLLKPTYLRSDDELPGFVQTERGLTLQGVWIYSFERNHCLVQVERVIVQFRCENDASSSIGAILPGQEVNLILQNSQIEAMWLSPE